MKLPKFGQIKHENAFDKGSKFVTPNTTSQFQCTQIFSCNQKLICFLRFFQFFSEKSNKKKVTRKISCQHAMRTGYKLVIFFGLILPKVVFVSIELINRKLLLHVYVTIGNNRDASGLAQKGELIPLSK